MMRNMDLHSPYLNGKIPIEIVENLKEFFPEQEDDLSFEEVLMQQESVFLWIQENGRNRDKTSGYGHSRDGSQLSGQEGESSHGGNTNSQIALDEALARSLQELGDNFEDFYIAEHSGSEAAGTGTGTGTGTGSTEASPTETPVRLMSPTLRQDDIDPDNMTYEQLQSLCERTGNENKGLPEKLISQLPTFKYKTEMFRKKKKEECVICYMVYNSGERLTTLPCAHQYHSKCIKRWLKLQKHCPVCQTEVQDA